MIEIIRTPPLQGNNIFDRSKVNMGRGHLARCLRESNKNEGIDEKKDDTLRDTLLGSAKNIADTDGIEAINIL